MYSVFRLIWKCVHNLSINMDVEMIIDLGYGIHCVTNIYNWLRQLFSQFYDCNMLLGYLDVRTVCEAVGSPLAPYSPADPPPPHHLFIFCLISQLLGVPWDSWNYLHLLSFFLYLCTLLKFPAFTFFSSTSAFGHLLNPPEQFASSWALSLLPSLCPGWLWFYCTASGSMSWPQFNLHVSLC